MTVGAICKQVPAYLPHELLGYPKDSIEGTLLTAAILTKLNQQESEASKEHNIKSSSRMNKFKANK